MRERERNIYVGVDAFSSEQIACRRSRSSILATMLAKDPAWRLESRRPHPKVFRERREAFSAFMG